MFCARGPVGFSFFFFNDTATTEIYTLSLHDALPILAQVLHVPEDRGARRLVGQVRLHRLRRAQAHREDLADLRSEEHTSELQSRQYLVCRLLLEKKNKHYRQWPLVAVQLPLALLPDH